MKDVKGRILNSAIKNFAKYGFHKASTIRVAKDAKTSESAIYRFFHHKEEILNEIFVDSWREINSNVSKEITDYKDPYQNLRKMIEISLNYFLTDLDRTKVLLRESIPEWVDKTKLEQEYNRFITKIDDILLDGIEKGIFDKTFNPRVFRQALYGAMEQILYAFFIKGKTHVKKEEALEILYLFAGGIVVEKLKN